MALMGGVIRNANTNTTLAFANACITGQFTCYSTDGQGIWNNLRDNATTGYEGINITCSAGGFHSKSVNLVSSDIAYYPALGVNGYWKVVELTPKPPDTTSCFTPDTLVTMADGESRRIEEVVVGDLVVAQDGGINRVIGIETPWLGDRRLFSLNEDEPFITSEHPIMTERGWAAINPSATAGENPDLPVVALRVGEIIHRLRSIRVPAMANVPTDHAEVHIEPTKLERIVSEDAAPGTMLYNLLLDRDHTYFANGYLVHNKGSH